jgi:anion-transporting  ArsA/GET3 family ATPase
MMLDPKRTFDDLVEWYAPDEDARDSVLSNRIYQQLSNAVAGSQEYMAMEKLHELHQEGRYDLLVLDTPPTRHALDFLDAPGRLTRFIDSRSLKLLTAPGRVGMRVLGRGSGVAFGLLRRATGIDLLRDLSEFFRAMGGMADGIRERAARVDELLHEPRTSFLLITSPRADAIDEAVFFHRRLREQDLPFGGIVVNRIHALADADPRDGELAALLGDELAAKVERNLGDYRRLAQRDHANVEQLRARLGRTPMLEIPHLDDDVHDLDGLAAMNEYLFSRR